MNKQPALRPYATVRIDGRAFPFTSFAEVSAAYRATIDHLGIGGSETPRCEIFDGAGRQTGYISYNGRAWEYDPDDPFGHANSNRCLYDPRPGPGAGELPPHRRAPEPVWTEGPEAAALLAACAANPPETRYAKGTFGPNDGAVIYSEADDRMKRLAAIWNAERARLLKLADRTGDYSTFDAHCRLTVQDAVAAGVATADLQAAA